MVWLKQQQSTPSYFAQNKRQLYEDIVSADASVVLLAVRIIPSIVKKIATSNVQLQSYFTFMQILVTIASETTLN